MPDDVPPARAVLAGTVETAVNALWDAAPLVGDRIAVVGAGMVGCCVAACSPGFPACEVKLVDADPGRAEVAAALGVDFAAAGRRRRRPRPGRARQRDVRRPAALAGAARAGGHRHRAELVRRRRGRACRSAARSTPGRLTIRTSQVGTVSPARRARRTTADRLALALDLLRDPAFDALITGASRFAELPDVMARLAGGSLPALCHTITYGEE